MSLAPTRPLGKIYTLKKARSIIIRWVKKETQEDLAPELVDDFINLSVLDVAEILSGAGSEDYGKTDTITDDASNFTANVIINASYVDSTRTITKAAHGHVAADVGRRIIYFSDVGIAQAAIPAPRVCIAEIESITDLDNFVVTEAAGADMTSAQYGLLSAHAETNVDISSYKIASLIKIHDSVNNEVIKVGDIEFDNLYRFDEKQKRCYWYKSGQFIYLYKGTSVAAWGTLTMHSNSYPQTFDADQEGEFLDIRDMYSALYIAKAKNYCLEHLGLVAPESLTQTITGLTERYRENILAEKSQNDNKNTSSKRT